MKSNKLLLILGACGTVLYGAEQGQGPMNAESFYRENNPFKQANDLHQVRDWKNAEELYELLLQSNVGSQDDKENAKLNLAACAMAQRKPSEHWASFDTLLGIPEEQQISQETIENAKNKEPKKSILVRTDKVGIGDIFHFIKNASELKKRTGWDVTISVPNFLKGALSGATKEYDLNVVGARDEQPKTDHTTHIIGLLGHLKMDPAAIAPEDVLFNAPERAINAIDNQILPALARGKTIAVVFLGENRQATLIGGKQLPRDTTKHGRHLDSQSFNWLLKKHPELVLMDCGGKDSRVAIDEDQKDQYMQIAPEEQPFDTLQALALAMNVNKKIIAIGADNGPTNVFARALNKEAQRRMGLIIPNGSKKTGEYDMRMEGEGSEYTQMISNCRVYKCETPQDQTEVIEKAYQDMTANK
jgi:hypothetical protein